MGTFAPPTETGNPELWVGDIEPDKEGDWGFTVFGPDKEPLTHFHSVTREQADRAREVMLTVLDSADEAAPAIHFDHHSGQRPEASSPHRNSFRS
jgi:hypothetical protein